MIDLYSHEIHRFADQGLQLRLPVDLVPQNQYSRFTNAITTIEGQLQTRAGLVPQFQVSSIPIHSIFRLNQVSNVTPTQRLFGSGTLLYSQVIPGSGVDLVHIANGTNFDGGPLSIIDYRFDFDPNSWAIIANSQGMAKVRVRAAKSTATTNYPVTSTTVQNVLIPSGGTVFVTQALFITMTGPIALSNGARITPSGWTAHPEYNGVPLGVYSVTGNVVEVIVDGTPTYGATAETGTVAAVLNPSNSYLAWVLGQQPPTLAATASDGGVGLLDNGAGPGFDWRYTYVNSIVNSESNPSPITGVIGSQSPTANLNPDSSAVPQVNAFISSKTQPWVTTGGINLSFQYGDGSGSAPYVLPATLIPGTFLTINYVSGTVQCSDARPKVTGAGQTNAITGTTVGSTGNRFPTFYMLGSNLGLGGLCGAFCDNTGQVITPLSIGLGGTFLVPIGASQLQLGIDDDRLSDNAGGFSVSITGLPTTGCTNPASAYDGNTSTFANFIGGSGGSASSQSCRYSAWASIGTVLGISLDIDSEVIVTGPGDPTQVEVTIDYTIDNGLTWTNVYQANATRVRKIDSINFAVAVDISQMQVRAIASGASATSGIVLKLYEVSTQTQVGAVSVLALVNKKALVCCEIPRDPQQDTLRLYRRGGSLTDGWKKVGDFPISKLTQGGCGAGTLEITDNVPDVELTDLLDLDNDMPVSGISALNTPLAAIWGPANRRVLGVGDPSRPDSVYFSKPGNADSWPPQNWLTVSSPSDPMMNGCIYNTRNFAFSMERMWELVEGLVSGVTYSAYPTPTIRGLISRWGLCVYDRIYFVSKDGIYATTGGQETSIVENDIKPLFPTKDTAGQSVNGYEAVDMTQPDKIRLSAHNDEIYFTYAGVSTGTLQTLIYDTRKNRWRPADYTPDAHTFYSEPATTSSLLIGGEDGTLYQSGGGADNQTPISVSLRTGAHDQGQPLSEKEYGSVIFDLAPGGANVNFPITITPYVNGEQIQESALTITSGSTRSQVPLSLQDVIAYNLEFEVTWQTGLSSTSVLNYVNPVLYQYDIIYRFEPTRLTHWEARENSYGMPGYFHIRDGYIGIRSQDPVNLTFYADGSTTPFTTVVIPSTGNLRKRVYFSLPGGFKYKMLRISADVSGVSAGFKLYEQDIQFRAKNWLGVMGYQQVKMIGAESQQVNGAWAANVLGG